MFAKIFSVRPGAVGVVGLVLLLAGCTPTGPRAFLKGKKLLDQGDFAAAAAQFKTAATVLVTNAAAWNYYGVSLQHAGLPDEAATAYARALECNRDLVEAHFNLGSLWLEQNKLDAARTEFTAYTLRRNNDPTGWLKLGSAELKLGETVLAEKCYSTVLALRPADPEAYNGLGLARIQRGKPHDAAEFFAAAVSAHPDFAPARLNLATTVQQYLHDNRAALEDYRAYLRLTPRPANWDEVNAIATSLEQSLAPVVAAAPTPPPVVAPVVRTSPPAPVAVRVARPAPTEPVAEARPQPKPVVLNSPRPAPTPKPVVVRTAPPTPVPAPVVAAVPTQVVKVQPDAWIVTTPKPATETSPVTPESIEVPMPDQPPKPGFWHKVFGSNKGDNMAPTKNIEQTLTPLPAASEPAAPAPEKNFYPPPPPPTFTRYQYISPPVPRVGDRIPASGAFTKARIYEQDEKWTEALQWYQQAADMDPSWFEAQYNTGVLAHRLRNYPLALPSYENALAIRPDSVDARYNFALALKAAGHAPDAADELQKILAAHPDEVRAHLALANLYAQTLRDVPQARTHYLKVLELEPDNAQASDIRFWLSANPQ